MRRKSFDYLRAFCMLYIVAFWHLLDYLGRPEGYVYDIAEQITFVVLSVFFMLSGFLNGSEKNRNILNFYKIKLLRIYPLYILALICFFILGLNDGVTTVKALLGISVIADSYPVTLWFVSMLVLLYFITPFLVRLRNNTLLYFVCMFLVLCLASFESYSFHYIHENFCYYFPSYVIGIYLYKIGNNEKHRMNLANYSLIVVVLMFFIKPYLPFGVFASSIATLLAIALMVFCLECENKFKSNRLVEYLALGSYVSYLFHRPAYEVVNRLVDQSGKVPSFVYYFTALFLVLMLSGKIQSVSDYLLGNKNPLLRRLNFNYR